MSRQLADHSQTFATAVGIAYDFWLPKPLQFDLEPTARHLNTAPDGWRERVAEGKAFMPDTRPHPFRAQSIRSPLACVSTWMEPPVCVASIAYFTAFSTSGCKIKGGDLMFNRIIQPGIRIDWTSKRRPHPNHLRAWFPAHAYYPMTSATVSLFALPPLVRAESRVLNKK